MLSLADVTKEKIADGDKRGGPIDDHEDRSMRRIFMVLHGYYGNLLLSKFQTGRVLEDGPNKGEDEGMANARAIWTHGLREFNGEVIRAALRDVQKAYVEFPPSLPQFQALCRARAPRGPKVLRDEKGAPLLLQMDQTLVSKYARRAREINERHAARALATNAGFRPIQPGLNGLKEAIANAVGTAGGDEATELLRLDRLFAKVSHG